MAKYSKDLYAFRYAQEPLHVRVIQPIQNSNKVICAELTQLNARVALVEVRYLTRKAYYQPNFIAMKSQAQWYAKLWVEPHQLQLPSDLHILDLAYGDSEVASNNLPLLDSYSGKAISKNTG